MAQAFFFSLLECLRRRRAVKAALSTRAEDERIHAVADDVRGKGSCLPCWMTASRRLKACRMQRECSEGRSIRTRSSLREAVLRLRTGSMSFDEES